MMLEMLEKTKENWIKSFAIKTILTTHTDKN